MILYTCASCQRELEVEDSLAGQRVKCPHCGNVEVIPSTARVASAPAAPSRVSAPTSQTFAPSPDGPETELKRVHPVVFRSRPAATLGVFTLIFSGFALAMAAYFSATFATMKWIAYVGWFLSLVGLGCIAWWKIDSMSTVLTITTRRTIFKRGLFGRFTREIFHSKVSDIEVTQTFAQRLLRTGTLGIDDAGSDDIEIVINNLSDPDGLRETINSQRSAR